MIGTCDRVRISRHTSMPEIARQHHVEQHERGTHGVERCDRLGAVGRDLHPEPLALQRDAQCVAVRLLVVDDEDQRRVGHQTTSCRAERSVADSGSSGRTEPERRTLPLDATRR